MANDLGNPLGGAGSFNLINLDFDHQSLIYFDLNYILISYAHCWLNYSGRMIFMKLGNYFIYLHTKGAFTYYVRFVGR